MSPSYVKVGETIIVEGQRFVLVELRKVHGGYSSVKFVQPMEMLEIMPPEEGIEVLDLDAKIHLRSVLNSAICAEQTLNTKAYRESLERNNDEGE